MGGTHLLERVLASQVSRIYRVLKQKKTTGSAQLVGSFLQFKRALRDNHQASWDVQHLEVMRIIRVRMEVQLLLEMNTSLRKNERARANQQNHHISQSHPKTKVKERRTTSHLTLSRNPLQIHPSQDLQELVHYSRLQKAGLINSQSLNLTH